MAWRDELRPASFRGVPFFVSGVDGDHGRRLATHEYPSRDDPYLEDMGRRARERTVEGYILEPDHIQKSKDLIDACERAGPGTLVHPWLGEMQVVCTSCRQSFSAADGGMCRFSLGFTEAGQARYPEATENAAAATDVAGLSADEANLRQLSKEFGVEGFPDYVSTDAVDGVKGFAADVKETIGPAIESAQAAAKWAQGVAKMVADAQALVRNPLLLGNRILGVLDIGNVSGMSSITNYGLGLAQDAITYASTGQTPVSWTRYLTLANWTPSFSAIGLTTSIRIQQSQNRTAFTGFVRRTAVTQAARSAVRQRFETQQEALYARDTIADLIDTHAETASDDVFRASMALRAKVVRSLSAAAPTLPKIITVQLGRSLPSVVVSHQLYGDDPTIVIARADDIVTRNKIRHPLFVPGAVDIQAITTTK